MKASARQLTHLHRRGWTWNPHTGHWTRPRSQFDQGGLGRRASLNLHNNANVIQVASAGQAIIVDDALKRRWDRDRQHAWPPELFGYNDALPAT